MCRFSLLVLASLLGGVNVFLMETTNAARLAALLADSDAAFEACMEGRLTLSEATAIDALYLDAMVASGTPVPLFDAVTPWSPRV